jgi:hypothetical protein
MHYALRPDLTFCFVQQRAIFLDVAADRYFSLDGPAGDSFSRLVAEKPLSPADDEALTRLVARGILESKGAGSVVAPCRHPAPRHSYLDAHRTSPGARRLPSVAWHLAATNLRLRRLPLAHMVQRVALAKKRSGMRPPGGGDLRKLAQTYEWTRRFIMPLDRCLVRAIALAGQAAGAGHRIDLVFGVQLRPFGAHCWVEYEGMVLDDRLDHVRNFTPILAV